MAIFVTGPVHLFAGPMNCSPGGAFYVGVGNRSPQVTETRFFRPVTTDRTGPQSPSEKVKAGSALRLVIDLISTSATGLNQLETLGDATAGSPGLHPAGSRGTLMAAEQAFVCAFLTFPMVTLKPAIYPNRPQGYRFPQCEISTWELPSRDGLVEAAITRVVIDASELETVLPSGLSNFLLKDQTINGLPAVT